MAAANDAALRTESAQERWVAAFERLGELLDRPAHRSEIEARLALGQELPADAEAWLRAGERLGYRGRLHRARERRLLDVPTPFLLIGRDADDVRLVRARMGRRLVVVEPLSGRTSALGARAAADRYEHILSLRPESGAGTGLRALFAERRFWPAFAQVAVASVFVNLLALATPIFMMTVYNRVIRHAAMSTLDALAVGMFTLVAFELILRALRARIATHTGARLDVEIGREVVARVLRLPLQSFHRLAAAGLLERLRQLDHLRHFLSGNLPVFLVDLLFVFLFLGALAALSPPLATLTVGAAAAFALLGWIARARQKSLAQRQSRATTAKNAALFEAVVNAPTVKGLALEPEMEKRLSRHLYGAAWCGLETGSLAQLAGSLAQALQHATAVLLVYVGARMVVAGELSIGALVACSILAARSLAPIRQLFLSWPQLQQARDALRRIDELLAREIPAPALRRAPVELELEGHLRFERVRFRYDPDRPPAIDGIDLDIPAGSVIALVGAPGSGKSTLVKLAAGVLEPDEGRVLVDGHDLRHLGPSYRRRLGYVPQEIQLFSGSIADNIAMGSDHCPLTRVVAAARFVGLHDVVMRLPKGYDTELGDGGAGLSTGQKQLVCIARALVRNPRLLLLDEATSALDAASEGRLLENLRRAGKGRTILLATHRPSAIAFCERAIVLREGRILHIGKAGDVEAAIRQGGGRRVGLHVAS